MEKGNDHSSFVIEALHNYGVINLNVSGEQMKETVNPFKTNGMIKTREPMTVLRCNTTQQITQPLFNPNNAKMDCEMADFEHPAKTTQIVTEESDDLSPISKLPEDNVLDFREVEMTSKADRSEIFDEDGRISPIKFETAQEDRKRDCIVTTNCVKKKVDMCVTISGNGNTTYPVCPSLVDKIAYLSTAIKEMTSIGEYLKELSRLNKNEYVQVLFDGTAYYEGVQNMKDALKRPNVSVIFQTENAVFGVNHVKPVGVEWNEDEQISAFCLKGVGLQQPVLFRSYSTLSSRLFGHYYDVLGFCQFDMNRAVVEISSKFQIHFIDFTGLGISIFGCKQTKSLFVRSFAVVEWT
ncbi:hypothetical protein EIN_226770 [Entamoeba invadens IP1]|uniref:Uncharacterized protein n=1 Tax=Entamoeba invadens IP1 TaxID=370355 RepID=A0A0A1U2N8_ENTIV|nr:hypothetical protein EIN_226770 [Entamoeba invadens IP1]ELP88294.1 hypothetical protein EIN_226770 [Entamoeba invadens IP1]|eukprot:XP_004255065.1 hypothetical protein EIN_226770 [Entamoeba invadens IP1]